MIYKYDNGEQMQPIKERKLYKKYLEYIAHNNEFNYSYSDYKNDLIKSALLIDITIYNCQEALENLFFSLNPLFIESLSNYASELYNISLIDLCKLNIVRDKTKNNLMEFIKDLDNNTDISCMEDYYYLIDMLAERKKNEILCH